MTVSKLIKKIPSWLYKHPVISSSILGAGLLSNFNNKKYNIEESIMREYSGTSGSKYAGTSFSKFAAHKDACLAVQSTINILNKKAMDQSFETSLESGIGSGVGRGLANEAIAAIRKLLGFSAQKAVNKLKQEPKRQQIVQQIVEADPYVSEFERQNPGQTAQAFQTMKQVAPSLSLDPNIVKSYLRNTAMTGGALDFTTVRSLADAEAAVNRAKSESAWGRGGFR